MEIVCQLTTGVKSGNIWVLVSCQTVVTRHDKSAHLNKDTDIINKWTELNVEEEAELIKLIFVTEQVEWVTM